jgi:hypothetical protein
MTGGGGLRGMRRLWGGAGVLYSFVGLEGGGEGVVVTASPQFRVCVGGGLWRLSKAGYYLSDEV